MKFDTMRRAVRNCFFAYFELRISASAAELSYYFLFSVFPLIMATGAVAAMSGFGDSILVELLGSLLPELVSELFDDYHTYITEQNNTAYFSFGLLLALYAIARYINSIKRNIREIYGESSEHGFWREWLLSFVFAVLIVLGFYFTFLLQTAGERFLNFLSEHIFFIPEYIMEWWLSLRFAAMGVYVFVLLLLTYRAIPEKKLSFGDVFGGALFSTVAWLSSSMAFSFYVDNISDYSVSYGSMGAFIALMLWLFIVNNIILTGALINKVFGEKKTAKPVSIRF